MIVECTGEIVSENCILSLAKHVDKESNASYKIEIEYNNMVTLRKSKSIEDESKAKLIYEKLKDYIKRYGIPSEIEFDTFISSRL